LTDPHDLGAQTIDGRLAHRCEFYVNRQPSRLAFAQRLWKNPAPVRRV